MRTFIITFKCGDILTINTTTHQEINTILTMIKTSDIIKEFKEV